MDFYIVGENKDFYEKVEISTIEDLKRLHKKYYTPMIINFKENTEGYPGGAYKMYDNEKDEYVSDVLDSIMIWDDTLS